jgi:hypothetical protein
MKAVGVLAGALLLLTCVVFEHCAVKAPSGPRRARETHRNAAPRPPAERPRRVTQPGP